MPLGQQRPQLVERCLPGRNLYLTGPRPVRGSPEEQHPDAFHLYSLGSGTYSAPTTTFRVWGMTPNSAGSSPMSSPSAVNSSPPGSVSTPIFFALAEKTPSLPR